MSGLLGKVPYWLLLLSALAACKPERLPVLGKDQVNGKEVVHRIPDFRMIDQDSLIVTNETFAGKAYVADFFFTSCPSICPLVKKQMLRIYDRFRDDDRFLLLSYTIDPKRDSVARLRQYAESLGVESQKWHFVTGDKDDIYNLADDYFSIAIEDPDAPGGFDHSGRLILVDRDRQVRAFCNGTVPEEVDLFIRQIEKLLHEEY